MLLLLFWDWGSGRAKGLGGPVAPAESSAEADGEGGGRTGPAPCVSTPLRRLPACEAVSCRFRGDVVDSCVLLPASDASSGICTLSLGLGAPPTRRLLDREGGVKVVSGTELDTEFRPCEALELPVKFDVWDR